VIEDMSCVVTWLRDDNVLSRGCATDTSVSRGCATMFFFFFTWLRDRYFWLRDGIFSVTWLRDGNVLSRGCATISVAWLRDSTNRGNGSWNLFNSRPYKTTTITRGIGAGACLYFCLLSTWEKGCVGVREKCVDTK
jgi:hypothetical protein